MAVTKRQYQIKGTPFVITVLFFLYFAQSCSSIRTLVWQMPDQQDQFRFPQREITKSDDPFYFPKKTNLVLNDYFPNVVIDNRGYDSIEDLFEDEQTAAFVIIQRDSIIYEKYFQNQKKRTKHPSFSVAKSFISALIGIAIEEKLIHSIEDPITNYIPELKDPKFQKVTIQHLLDMRSGIQNKKFPFGFFSFISKSYYGTNLERFCHKLKVVDEPNTRFEYNNLNTQLLGILLERATNKSISAYLEEKIWHPLGMEYNATWNLDHEEGMEKAFCCLNATVLDFAKLGRLYLNKGKFKDKQIVPQHWVNRSTCCLEDTVEICFEKPIGSWPATKKIRGELYQNHWWHHYEVLDIDGKPAKDTLGRIGDLNFRRNIGKVQSLRVCYYNAFSADGLYAQKIYVYPKKDLIIVRLGFSKNETNWDAIFKMIADQL